MVGGAIAPCWMLDGASFWYVEGAPYNTIIYRVDGETGRVAPLLDVAKTRNALAAVLGHAPPCVGLPFDSVKELGDDRFQFSFEGTNYVLSTTCYQIESVGRKLAASLHASAISRAMGLDPIDRTVPRHYRRPMLVTEPMVVREAPSPDKSLFARVSDGNIILRASVDDRTMALTTDGTPDYAWDIEAPRPKLTAGHELGEHLLNPWSPDGDRLFAVKIDRRGVPDLPLIRHLKREDELCSIKIQRAGGPMDIGHPHVIDVLAKRAQRLDVREIHEQFFTLVGWLRDGSEVLFTRHSRDFKSVELLAGDPVTGSVRTVLSESATTFVALQHDVLFFGDNHITVLADGSGLIWRSSRSGWNHFYLYALDGTLTRALTQGAFSVVDVVALDYEGQWVYFTAHHDQDRPYDTHLCRVRITGDELQRLTSLDGENVVVVSPLQKTFTAVNSRPDRPFRTDVYACDGKHLAKIHQANVSAMEAIGHVASEEFTVIAADGKTVLWGVMHKPADFDRKMKYPVIDHLYGGPQVTMVRHHFGLGDDSQSRLDRALAQLGYIVISVDARGTPVRSKAFQDVVYGNFGRHEILDHVATLQQLAKQHTYIDLNRVGVWGHSWGGYFTVRALAQAPDVFHVGVAVAPGADPYDAILYEPYLDLPTRAKAAYVYAGNYRLASRITGKLMLVVGSSDSFLYSNTLKMAHSLIQAGVDYELVVLPDEGHNLLGENDNFFVRKLVSHFEVHLNQRTAG